MTSDSSASPKISGSFFFFEFEVFHMLIEVVVDISIDKFIKLLSYYKQKQILFYCSIMGSGASAVSPVHHLDDEILETRLLSSGESISALLKYLEEEGKSSILNWYLDILEYKNMEPKNLLLRAMEIRAHYDNLILNKVENAKTMIAIWQSVDRTLPCKNGNLEISIEKISRRLDEAKRYTLSLLSKEVDGFEKSTHLRNLQCIESKSHLLEKTCIKKIPIQLSDDLQQSHNDILLIEESPLNASRIAKSLEANGHFVCQAHHGRVAIHLTIMSGIKFGAVLIDMSMSTMDPLEVVQKIKASCNGTIFISKPPQLLQSKSLRMSALSKASQHMFFSNRIASLDIKNQQLSTTSILDTAESPVFIALFKNNPTYQLDPTYFDEAVSMKTTLNSEMVTDLSILGLIFELHSIINKLYNSDSETDGRPLSSVTNSEEGDYLDDKIEACISILSKFKKLLGM